MSVSILIGDVRAKLAEIEPESIDCVVTSPPYWGLRDYGIDGQLGMERTLGEHLAVMVEVFDLVRRTMKPEATLWLNYGDCYATKPKDLCMVPNRIAIALQEAGWWVRSEIVWGKPNPMPDSSGRYRPSTAHEKIWLLSKSAKCFYDSEAVRMPAASGPEDHKMPDGWDIGPGGHGSVHRFGREKGAPAPKSPRGHAREHQGFAEKWDGMTRAEQMANGRLLRNYEPDLSPIITPEVWSIATAAFSEAHFATFPPALVAPCILAGCPIGGTVLDPFFGAGTTGLVADRLGRNCIGIELNPEYAALAQRRIEGDSPMFAQVEAA